MFRGVTSTMWVLSILLCPLYCGEASDAASATTSCRRSDDCFGYGCGRSTDQGKRDPMPCAGDCSRDCMCKGLLEGQVKFPFASVDFWLSVGDEYDVAVPVSSPLLPAAVRPRSATHPDLCSGAAIRLAFASLLI